MYVSSLFTPVNLCMGLIEISVVPSENGVAYYGLSSVWFDGHWQRLSSL